MVADVMILSKSLQSKTEETALKAEPTSSFLSSIRPVTSVQVA